MKIFHLILSLGIIGGTFSCSDRDSLLNKSQWLVGTWEIQSPQGIYYEAWSYQNDSLLLGKSFAVDGKDTQYFESIEIREEGGNLFYIPTVDGENNNLPVRFKLTESAPALIFENSKHDFPQRIRYEQLSSDSLIAEISGSQDGEMKTLRFPMRKTN